MCLDSSHTTVSITVSTTGVLQLPGVLQVPALVPQCDWVGTTGDRDNAPLAASQPASERRSSLTPSSLDYCTMTPLANDSCCQVCKRILVGTWIPWRTPTSADGRWGIYEFHKTLQDLRDCVQNESCPICKIALARGNWANSSPLTETTFAHMPEDAYMSINITPNGGTSELQGCCYITLRKGISHFTVLTHLSTIYLLSGFISLHLLTVTSSTTTPSVASSATYRDEYKLCRKSQLY